MKTREIGAIIAGIIPETSIIPAITFPNLPSKNTDINAITPHIIRAYAQFFVVSTSFKASVISALEPISFEIHQIDNRKFSLNLNFSPYFSILYLFFSILSFKILLIFLK